MAEIGTVKANSTSMVLSAAGYGTVCEINLVRNAAARMKSGAACPSVAVATAVGSNNASSCARVLGGGMATAARSIVTDAATNTTGAVCANFGLSTLMRVKERMAGASRVVLTRADTVSSTARPGVFEIAASRRSLASSERAVAVATVRPLSPVSVSTVPGSRSTLKASVTLSWLSSTPGKGLAWPMTELVSTSSGSLMCSGRDSAITGM
mmetsp:Transcript_53962/g.128232  ORF Transcript_53962/g.128232 Transcript_53962/m.128232 type:complete len:210 (+) Transcript_53962:388-1017(+)